MSYVKTVSEEMQIHVVDNATKLVAKLLGYYIDNFYSLYQISYLDLFDASLTVDGETISMKNFNIHDGKVFHIASRGKNKGKYVPLGSKPSVYYAFRQWARELHEAKDISFTVHYEAYRCLGDDIGIKCMITALDGLNCASVRKNVTYKGMEEYDFCEGITLYRFDKDYQGYAVSTDDSSVLNDVENWEMNFNTCIAYSELDENNPFRNPEIIREVLEKTNPFFEKYGIGIEKYKDGDDDINLYGYVFIKGNALEEFIDDLETVVKTIESYGLDICLVSDHLVSRDYGKFAVVRFGYTDEGDMTQTFVRM